MLSLLVLIMCGVALLQGLNSFFLRMFLRLFIWDNFVFFFFHLARMPSKISVKPKKWKQSFVWCKHRVGNWDIRHETIRRVIVNVMSTWTPKKVQGHRKLLFHHSQLLTVHTDVSSLFNRRTMKNAASAGAMESWTFIFMLVN